MDLLLNTLIDVHLGYDLDFRAVIYLLPFLGYTSLHRFLFAL